LLKPPQRVLRYTQLEPADSLGWSQCNRFMEQPFSRK
jgi:hypothetical protein